MGGGGALGGGEEERKRVGVGVGVRFGARVSEVGKWGFVVARRR